jgi:ubiquinone/menaquinone biosynthesis C-methylase UbiE
MSRPPGEAPFSDRPEMTRWDSRIQRDYYEATAADYDSMHVSHGDEHYFALAVLAGLIEFLEAQTLLDVGSGTGRALLYLKRVKPQLSILGIEPVEGLRNMGYRAGLRTDELVDGDATSLNLADASYDVVSAFGVLHHVRDQRRVVNEMWRVARTAIYISDSNNFGQGRPISRAVKQMLHACRLWPAANLLKTRGRGYSVSRGDGLNYTYSVFDTHSDLRKVAKSLHLINTLGDGANPYRSAPHVALLAVKP